MNPKAPPEEQRKMLITLRGLEVPPDESVRESDLIKACRKNIKHPKECITALHAGGYISIVLARSGVFVRRTEK